MQFELPRRHRKSFEVSTKKKLNTKFNKSESLEIFETIKKEYNSSPVTFGSSSGKKEALLELLIITASQIAEIIGGVSRNAVIGKAHRLNLSQKIKVKFNLNIIT